nr:hypothetical protein [Providencia vermicola]
MKNGVKAVAKGANMPTTIPATELFLEAGVLFALGKAANTGGVVTSGLEMRKMRLVWVGKLRRLMRVCIILC